MKKEFAVLQCRRLLRLSRTQSQITARIQKLNGRMIHKCADVRRLRFSSQADLNLEGLTELQENKTVTIQIKKGPNLPQAGGSTHSLHRQEVHNQLEERMD